MEKSRYGATAAEVADTLTPGMRAALGTGHASSHGATVISNPQTIKALRSRGLIGSDNRVDVGVDLVEVVGRCFWGGLVVLIRAHTS